MIELSSQQAQDFAEPIAVYGGNITANYVQSRNKCTFNLPLYLSFVYSCVCVCVCVCVYFYKILFIFPYLNKTNLLKIYFLIKNL